MKKLLLVIGLVLALSASTFAAAVPATFGGEVKGEFKSLDGKPLTTSASKTAELYVTVSESYDNYSVYAEFGNLFQDLALGKYKVTLTEDAWKLNVWGGGLKNGTIETPFGWVSSGEKAAGAAKARLMAGAVTVDVDADSNVYAFGSTNVAGQTIGGAVKRSVGDVATPVTDVAGYIKATAGDLAVNAEIMSRLSLTDNNNRYGISGSMPLTDAVSANASYSSNQIDDEATLSLGGAYAANGVTISGSYANVNGLAGALKENVKSVSASYLRSDAKGDLAFGGSYEVSDNNSANLKSTIGVNATAPIEVGSSWVYGSYKLTKDADITLTSDEIGSADEQTVIFKDVDTITALSVGAHYTVNAKMTVDASYKLTNAAIGAAVESVSSVGASAAYVVGKATLYGGWFTGVNDYDGLDVKDGTVLTPVVEKASKIYAGLKVAF